MTGDGLYLQLITPGSQSRVSINASLEAGPFISISDDLRAGIMISEGTSDVYGAQIALTDRRGFKAELGTSTIESTQTGEVRQKTAASLTLFDNEVTVIAEVP